MTRFTLAVLLGVLIAAPSFGISPDPKDLAIPPEELSKARELIHKLGSEVYKEREEAHAELTKMGRLARPALLEAAANDPDPEVRFRTSRLLPKAGADDLKARLDTFLADTDGKYEHDLPGLKQFRKVVGHDEKARALFVTIVKSPYNVEVLQAMDRNETEAGRAISDRRGTMYSMLQQRVFNGRIVQPQQVPLEDIACLLFAETVIPAKEIPRNGMWGYVTGSTFIQQGSSNNALVNNGVAHSEAYKRIVGEWLETRDDVQDLNQLPYIVGQQLRNLPQSMPLLRKIIKTDGVYGYAKGQALMYLVRGREKEERDFLISRLNDDTLVTTVWFGNIAPNQQPQQHQCLIRDVALAMLITHTGQKMQDYGFKFPNGQPIPNNGTIGYGNYAFDSDQARAAAMVKFGFWQLKQSFKPAEPDPKEKEQPKSDTPPLPEKPKR